MRKKILLSLFLIAQLVIFGNDLTKQPEALTIANPIVTTSDSVNEIVDNRDIFQDKDLEEIKIPEFKIEDISRKIISLETENIILKEKIEKLEESLNEKKIIVEDLSNKVEKLILVTNSLDEMGKTFLPKTVDEINNKLYRTGMIIISVLAGITLILISLVVLQTNKNKKMVEEWKDFFDMNIDVLKRENKNSSENMEDEFVNRMKDNKTSDLDDEIFL